MTVVAHSRAVGQALEAAKELEKEGVKVEVGACFRITSRLLIFDQLDHWI